LHAIGMAALRRQEHSMFALGYFSTRHYRTLRGLVMALAITFALGALPLVATAQPSSAAPIHSKSSGQATATNSAKAGTDKATQHSIIFVGGRKQGAASQATNPHAVPPGLGHADHAANSKAHPPGPCKLQTGMGSASNDCSLNPQPIPPGHQSHRAAEGTVTKTSLTPRSHRPVANPRKEE
jgi:hypothetical protein